MIVSGRSTNNPIVNEIEEEEDEEECIVADDDEEEHINMDD